MNQATTIQQVLPGVFEGYVGIRLGEGQLVNDVIFASVFLLFILFAVIYRSNFRLFFKMLQDLYYVKERQSLFMPATNNTAFFRGYMTFQTIALCSISLFSIGRLKGLVPHTTGENTAFLLLFSLFALLFIYYQFKQALYFCIGSTFFDRYKYKIWKTSYNAMVGTLGVLLYIPVLWMSFVGMYPQIPVKLFIILFILSRLVIIYKIIRIFYKKGDNILYLILYLCAQEILPVVFLYEGLVYLYNFIETSTLWH